MAPAALPDAPTPGPRRTKRRPPKIEGWSADTENTAPLRRQHRLRPTGLITTPAAAAPFVDIRQRQKNDAPAVSTQNELLKDQ